MSVGTNEPSKRNEALEVHHKSSSLKVPAHQMTRIPPQLATVYEDSRGSPHRDRGSNVGGHSLDHSLPVVLPSKRMSSPGGVPENSKKKQKQNGLPGCPVCLGPQHPLENCPVFHQDTHRFVCGSTR